MNELFAVGMNFREWCALDVEDERKINYTILRNGKVEYFTSDEIVSPSILEFVRTATIQFIKLFHNEWFVILR